MLTRAFGPSGLLVEVDDPAAARALAAWARDHGVAADEVVPAAATVLFDGVPDVAALVARLEGWEAGDAPPPGDLVEVPVTYDGEDLAFVAQAWGVGVDDVVAEHAATEFVAEFCGFAPGFSYLAGLPDHRAVPRLTTPRARVPRGAVALAGRWCGVYPSSSPGGWRVLGTTDAVLWDERRDPPAVLAPGTRVRFVPR